jgi:hypothetical protein
MQAPPESRQELFERHAHECDWRAAFKRDELIAEHGADYPMPDLLWLVAAPGCSKVGSYWDRCGAYYVEPIEGAQ